MPRPYAALFDNAFTNFMIEVNEDVFDLTELNGHEFEALMKWLYAGGWEFSTETRNYIVLLPPSPDEACSPSPRVWTWDEDLYGPAPKPRKIIPRFCKRGLACSEQYATCLFTHGNTIPCVDEPCTFDGRCAGEKRKTCTRMHASEGQVWNPTLVVCRA